jgi:hypothetical protein
MVGYRQFSGPVGWVKPPILRRQAVEGNDGRAVPGVIERSCTILEARFDGYGPGEEQLDNVTALGNCIMSLI